MACDRSSRCRSTTAGTAPSPLIKISTSHRTRHHFAALHLFILAGIDVHDLLVLCKARSSAAGQIFDLVCCCLPVLGLPRTSLFDFRRHFICCILTAVFPTTPLISSRNSPPSLFQAGASRPVTRAYSCRPDKAILHRLVTGLSSLSPGRSLLPGESAPTVDCTRAWWTSSPARAISTLRLHRYHG